MTDLTPERATIEMKGFNIWAANWHMGDAKKLRALKMDTIRVQFLPEVAGYENQLKAFHDVVLPDCAAHGIGIILNPWFKSDAWEGYQSEWVYLFREYDHRDCIVAYDLVNEPKDPAYLDEIHTLTQFARNYTRKPLIVQFGQGPDCSWADSLTPVNADNVTYSFHAYEPYPFTHQGLAGRETGGTWPGKHYGYPLDNAWLVRRYVPVMRFQRRYNVPILVGEMGCSAHCPDDDSARWFQAMTGLCDRLGWGYMIHAWRNSDWLDFSR